MESSIKLTIFFFLPTRTWQNILVILCSSFSFVFLPPPPPPSILTFFCTTRKSLHSKDDTPVRFRFFRHKSYAKKQIIDIAAAINSRSRVIAAATETCEDRSVTMPMEFTEKKNYREHELRKDKEKWMVISFSRNKTIVTLGRMTKRGDWIRIYIPINVCRFKGIYRTALATSSFHAPMKLFFSMSL